MSDESPVKLTNAQRELLLAAENDTIVWLTRAEYEAYRAAAKRWMSERPSRGDPDRCNCKTMCEPENKIWDALRAASILEGG